MLSQPKGDKDKTQGGEILKDSTHQCRNGKGSRKGACGLTDLKLGSARSPRTGQELPWRKAIGQEDKT